MSGPQVGIDLGEAARQGYAQRSRNKVGELRPADVVRARRAGQRALRWLRAPRNNGARAPRHIQQKMQLLRMKSHGS